MHKSLAQYIEENFNRYPVDAVKVVGVTPPQERVVRNSRVLLRRRNDALRKEQMYKKRVRALKKPRWTGTVSRDEVNSSESMEE